MKQMTMSYEYITPQKAQVMLKNKAINRTISDGTVESYANDIKSNKWDEKVGSAISFDENGKLIDGQHRLSAIIKADKGVYTWVCRNASEKGIYDNNRRRSDRDQLMIGRPDYEPQYRDTRYIGTVKLIIRYNGKSGNRRISPNEIIDFTDKHKEILDGYFLKMPTTSVAKINIVAVKAALFAAYCAGVPIDDILQFYKVLSTGMSTRQEEFPIIAYRNYLKDSQGTCKATIEELSRCQYALKKYLTKSCAKRTKVPDELLYPIPFAEEYK